MVLSIALHVGTHIDIVEKSRSIAINRFIGRGVLLDVKTLGSTITLQDFKNQADVFKNDFVFIKTCWDKFFGEEKYFKHPELSFEAIKWLISKKVNMVGIDAPGLARGKNHRLYDKYLADNNIFVIENLVNLNLIRKKVFKVYCFPLSIMNVEAVPARIIVEF
ncbi:MAG: cyclase family protein [Candidatus Bathyarchaeia archaeon]